MSVKELLEAESRVTLAVTPADHRGGLGKGRGLEMKETRRQAAGSVGGSTPPPRQEAIY